MTPILLRWMRHPHVQTLCSARSGILLLAIAAGVLAAGFARQHLQGLAADLEARTQLPMRAVIVAGEALAAGSRLGLDQVAVRRMPEAWLPADVLAPEDHPLIDQAILQHPLRAGDPVQWAFLVPPPERFSNRLAAGRRAITIPVDDMNSLAGMLQPGDHLDLFVSFNDAGERVTAPLLQNLRVLATGQQQEAGSAWADGDRFATVTLDAAPDEAVKLIAARQQGVISAMLRHGPDGADMPAEVRGDLATLLGIRDRSGPEPAVRPARVVPVLFGDRYPTAIPALDGSAVVPSSVPSWLSGLPEPAALPGYAAATVPPAVNVPPVSTPLPERAP